MAPPQLSLCRSSLRTYTEWVRGRSLPRTPDRPSSAGLPRRIVWRCGSSRPLPLDVGRRRERRGGRRTWPDLRFREDRRNPGSCKPLCPEKPEVDLCRRCTCFGVDPCHLPDLLELVHSSGGLNVHQDSFVDKTIRLGELTKKIAFSTHSTVTKSDHTSALEVCFAPRLTSGAMDISVPATDFATDWRLLRPKSPSWKRHSSSLTPEVRVYNILFSGFTSRCTMPCTERKSRAWSMWRMTSFATLSSRSGTCARWGSSSKSLRVPSFNPIKISAWKPSQPCEKM